MYWPNFQLVPIKPTLVRNKRTGQTLHMYTRDQWNQDYGQHVFDQVVKALPEDLPEGPRKEPPTNG